jgi:anti-sigma regulatory factor (Ser/Thr protein kinase)
MSASPTTSRRTARIPCGSGAPAEARRWATWLADAVDAETDEAIMVVVSELVTNAVRHAGLPPGAPIEVWGEVHPDRVTLTVRDRGAGLPPIAPPSLPPPDATGSRGLYLVARLATRVLMDPPRGAVTCEFDRGAVRRA